RSGWSGSRTTVSPVRGSRSGGRAGPRQLSSGIAVTYSPGSGAHGTGDPGPGPAPLPRRARRQGRPRNRTPGRHRLPGRRGPRLPFHTRYVANREQLSVLADVGVVLLLFEVGIEINPMRLAREGRRLLALAPIQVAATWLASAVVCYLLGVPLGGAAMIGLSIAMSSSVVVV